jgi:hypothetical protein
MNYDSFKKEQINLQLVWRGKQNDISKKNGKYKGVEKDWIVLPDEWIKTIWKQLQDNLSTYIKNQNIQPHDGAHDLLSSWVLCSNLYFGTSINYDFRELFRQFVERKIETRIENIDEIHLEFVPNERSKENLLGEPGNIKQTTPDLAIIFSSNNKKRLIIVESKYTEKSFYDCFGGKKNGDFGQIVNPYPENCFKLKTIENSCLFSNNSKWIRKYWHYLKISEYGLKQLTKCPALFGGYQLVRQQALAEAILKCGNYDNVWSCIAYDRRNEKLMKSMERVGIDSIKNEWVKLFDVKSKFETWEHQEWVEYVRKNAKGTFEKEWINYINERYNI